MPRKGFLILIGASAAIAPVASAVTFEPGRTEVVVAADAAPTTRFAGTEATNFLSRVLGAPVPLATSPTDGFASLVLGENEWSRAAGLNPSAHPRDTFITKAAGSRVYVCGRDDPKYDLARHLEWASSWAQFLGHERATVHGVYDFLERYAGVRFFMPGELGTVVPRRERIEVEPCKRVTTPDFLIREPYFGADGPWYCETDGDDRVRLKSLYWMRLKMGTATIPCCHGSQHFNYMERFAKDRPDFFALKEDGTRWTDPNVFAPNQYCWSNPDFQEVLYQDVKAYLTGQPASSRGIRAWGVNCNGKFVDIMPDDSFAGCRCERCQAAYKRDADGKLVRDYATELIWGVTARIAQRLIDEGIEGNIAQMAYLPYGRTPDFALPTNVHVMVALGGPWSVTDPARREAEYARAREWAEKVGHRIWVWTYPHKFGSTMIPDVPCVAPRAWGEYFKGASKWIFGSFTECESDKAIFNHLNYTVFSRICWNPKADVRTILDDYHLSMFGPAAEEMSRFNLILERKWLKGVAGRTEMTSLGPIAKAPSHYQLWHEVYSKEVRAELRRLIREASARVPAGSPESRRIALMKREILDPLLAAADRYLAETDVNRGLELRAREPDRSILPPDSWIGGFALDTADFVTPPNSMKIVASEPTAVRIDLQGGKGVPALKPNTRYRLSYFIKTENVEPRKMSWGGSGGVSVNIWDDHNAWYPSRNFFTGTMGWIFQSFEFTSGPNTNDEKNRSYLLLHLLEATGTVWFDDVRLEEIDEKGNLL